MGQKFFIITYRSNGHVFFFRGGVSYQIILSKFPGSGWVDTMDNARIFVRPPDFTEETIHPSIDGSELHIFHYDGPVLHTQVIRPTKRPDGYRGYRKRYKRGFMPPPPPKKIK